MLRRWRGKWLTVTLLIAALAGLVGHICVVPRHAHAVPIEGHGSHDDDATDHSVHTASCEAAKGGFSVSVVVPPSRLIELLAIAPSPRSAGQLGRTTDVLAAESPPLFLLHASLLI